MTVEDFHPHPAAADVPPPVGYQITIPDSASFPLTDLDQVRLLHVAAFLTTAAKILRMRPPAPMDGCLNRGTCTVAADPKTPVCLLCALDDAVVRHIPDGANTATAATIVHTGTIAKQLVIDTIEANARHGGEVFVLTHLAELIRSGALVDAARAAADDEAERALRAEYTDAADPTTRDEEDL